MNTPGCVFTAFARCSSTFISDMVISCSDRDARLHVLLSFSRARDECSAFAPFTARETWLRRGYRRRGLMNYFEKLSELRPRVSMRSSILELMDSELSVRIRRISN